MKTNTRNLLVAAALFVGLTAVAKPKQSLDDEVRQKMRAATEFMMDKVSYNGGFVWNYLPDFSRQWGEMEAKRTMVWIQPPGTPSVGHLLLDAYHATGDEYYYEQAERVASTLIWGQLDCGGWNYVFDFAGENSLKEWYATVGKGGWRLEEFQHYYGNATFDDGGTMEAANFLLRIYVEKRDPKWRPALDKVIRFVLDSQYPIGGWPQRYPLRENHPTAMGEDYTSFITLNDDVIPANIEFLTHCYQALGMQELKEPIYRAMYLIITLQQGAPFAGWADQYTVSDLKPAHARTYEPRSINVGSTMRCIRLLMHYYRMTGDTRFLNGIPAALDFLDTLALPEDIVRRSGYEKRRPLMEGSFLTPLFIHPETGTPLYVHRIGSNVYNGRYVVNQVPEETIAHYGSFVAVDTKMMREQFEAVKRIPRDSLEQNTPFLHTGLVELPKYFKQPSRRWNEPPIDYSAEGVRRILAALNKDNCWLTPLTNTSNPYRPCPDTTPSSETKYGAKFVGDEYDTSPYPCTTGEMCISVKTYIENMARLIAYLEEN